TCKGRARPGRCSRRGWWCAIRPGRSRAGEVAARGTGAVHQEGMARNSTSRFSSSDTLGRGTSMRTRNKTVRLNRSLLCCALAGCIWMAAPAALAQSTAATLQGRVSIDSTPAGNARVTVTNVATGLTRTVETTGNGSYSIAGLPPGTYRIDVTADGRTSSQTVTLAVGQTATLNLGVGGVAETGPVADAVDLDTVRVTAPMLVETRTSEVATYVSQKQIEALPQGTRNFLAFADTVPGMQFIQAAGGNTRLRSG